MLTPVRWLDRVIYSPVLCQNLQYAAYSIFFVLSYWNRRRTMLTTIIHTASPSIHDHAIKVDAVAESYLNVGEICCLVL